MDENGIFYKPYETLTSWPMNDSEFMSELMGHSPLIQLMCGVVRVKFHYDSKAWMVQMWKGRYGEVMLSGEIYVATKPPEQQAEHYFPAAPGEQLVFKLDVYQHNFLADKTIHLFTRGPEKAWRYNGFVSGDFYEFNKKEEIILVGSITFPDEEMLRA